MNSLRRVCSSSSNSSSSFLLRLRCTNTHYSTVTRKSNSKFPKPTEIPFQPKLANSVNLIGTVTKPIHFDTSPDGNPFAATVISRLDQDPSSLLIPVLFQGDLAHTANFHLKLNDVVHVAGQLSTDRPKHSNPQYQFQVMVQSLNFVQDYPPIKKDSKKKTASLYEKEDDGIHSEETGELVIKKSWTDIFKKPSEWQDDHSTTESPKSAAFESKTDGELQPEPKQSITSEKKYPDSSSNSWSDLLNDPKQWWDYRESKRSGLVKPKYPDFKRKDGNAPIWIDRAPAWVLSKLKELEFDAAGVKSKQAKESKDESWNDLIQNPTKWWDNRLDKKNERAPDFKHKDTGVGLWLKGSPSWVLPKLPPLKLKQQSAEPSWKQTPV